MAMSYRVSMLFVIALLMGFAAGETQAAQMMIFNMNDAATNGDGTTLVTTENVVGTPTLVLAGGSIDENGSATAIAYLDTASVNHAAGTAIGWDSGVNDAPDNTFSLNFDATGWENYTLRFDHRTTSTGPGTLTLEYKVGAGSFAALDTIALGQNSTYIAYSKDLSSISAIENIAGVTIRGTWSSEGTSSGTALIDNLELYGSVIAAVPTPAALPAGLGLMGWMMIKRRRAA